MFPLPGHNDQSSLKLHGGRMSGLSRYIAAAFFNALAFYIFSFMYANAELLRQSILLQRRPSFRHRRQILLQCM